jgi:hypothetical protein
LLYQLSYNSTWARIIRPPHILRQFGAVSVLFR